MLRTRALQQALVIMAALLMSSDGIAEVSIKDHQTIDSAAPPKAKAQPNIKKYPPRRAAVTSQVVDNEVVVGIKQQFLSAEPALEKREEELRTIGERLSTDFQTKLIAIYPGLGILRLRIPPDSSIAGFTENLKNDSQIEYVTPNFKGTLHSHNATPPNEFYWETHWASPPAYVGHAYLWGLDKIAINKAWRIFPGGQAWVSPPKSSTIVAVLDTGIDYEHPDLKENRWTNDAELKGLPGKDDDGNGYVDDIYGVNIIYETTTRLRLPHDCTIAPQPDPMDTETHGTMVAGTIGALGNNQEFVDVGRTTPDFQTAIVGVHPGVKLMPIKITCVHQGSVLEEPYLTDAIAGIEYAVRNKATVIVGSWGIYGASLQNTLVQKLRTAILDGKDTALYVASAGNEDTDIDGCVTPIWPQRFGLENEIVVAATDTADALWVKTARTGSNRCNPTNTPEGSNYGNGVDIAAPGDDEWILSVAAGGGQIVNAYGGTSAAAPHVAGCAALLQASRAVNSSTPFIPKDLKNILKTNGDPISGLKVASGNRLNCYKALFTQTPPAAPTNLKISRLPDWLEKLWKFVRWPRSPGPEPPLPTSSTETTISSSTGK